MTPTRSTLLSIAAAAVLTLTGPATAGAAPTTADTAADQDRPVLTVTGAPLVHTFDTTTPGDRVEGSWTLHAAGGPDAQWDGVFTPTGAVDASLAAAVRIDYAAPDPHGSLVWHPAGTLADPVTYAGATGHDAPLAAGDSLDIPVRATLDDPTTLAGAPHQVVQVDAEFQVTYLTADLPGTGGPDGGGTGGGTSPNGPGHLAVTGLTASTLAVLAALALTAGTWLARLRTRRTIPSGTAGDGHLPA